MKVDTTQSWWATLVSGAALVAANLEARFTDILAVLNGGITTDNVTTGGLSPNDTDGVAATLADDTVSPGTQTWTRDNQFNGDTGIGGVLTRTQAEISITADTIANVAGVNTLVVKNTSGSNWNLQGFSGGVEGQRLTVVLAASSGNIVAVNTYVSAAANEKMLHQGGANVTHTANAATTTGRVTILDYVLSDANGYFSEMYWLEISRRTA